MDPVAPIEPPAQLGPSTSEPDTRTPGSTFGGTIGQVAVLLAMVATAVAVVGGSFGWSLVRLALVGLAGSALHRLGGRHPLGSAAVGAIVFAVGVGLLPYLLRRGLSPKAVAAPTLVLTGATITVVGVGSTVAGRRWWWHLAAGAGSIVALAVTVSVVAPAILATNVPRPDIDERPDDRSLDADARGHGESDGRAMDFGWYGDVDVAAAVDHLESVLGIERIGLVGMSMGGEEVLGAAGALPQVRAVVAEGATARRAADKAWLSDVYGLRGAFQEQLERVQQGLTDLLTDAEPPTALRDAVGRTDADVLLITAGAVADEGHAADWIASSAPGRVEVWTVPGADHTGGLATDPDAWEQRVVDFLDARL